MARDCKSVQQLSIRNVKGSFIVPARSQDWIVQRCADLDVHCRTFPNFVQLYFQPTSLRVSFFRRCRHQQQKHGSGNDESKMHANVTGCANIEKFQATVGILADFLKCHAEGIEWRVENITATTNIKHLLRSQLALLDCIPYIKSTDEILDWRLNQETFSGLCIYATDCTGIVYSTGNIVLVGAKNWAACSRLASLLENIISKATHTHTAR